MSDGMVWECSTLTASVCRVPLEVTGVQGVE